MNHLPEIKDPAYPFPEIPCICRVDDYDGQGTVGFPERVGWQIDRQAGPCRIDESKSSIQSPKALLQAWLFFGLLSDVFRIGELDVDMSTYVQHGGNGPILTTAKLRDHLEKLARDAQQLKSETYLQRQKQVQTCFTPILNFLQRHWNTQRAKENWKLSPTLSLDDIMVVVILTETLRNAVMQMWPVQVDESPLRWATFTREQNPLQDRFLQYGWCPNEASMLDKEFDITGLVLASMLKRPFSNNLSHKICTEERCLALQTSDSNYETKHADDCGSCAMIVLDQTKICSILESGGIPIIYIPIFPENGQPPKVRIIDYNANSLEYIAISHVWAHGLGNPKANSLPSCQLLRLKSLSAQLEFSTTSSFRQPAFWIDTMCIPVNPEFKALRKVAIARLAATYRQARQVLVLDADLQRCSKNCSRTELAIRIVSSGWMRRLWTLQEAVMSDKVANAGKVDVQFLEGPVEFNAIAGKNIQTLHHTEYALKTIYSAFPQYRNRDRAFAFLARALEYRTTSKLEDEAICLASILGLEPKAITSIASFNTAQERMHTLYTLIEQIPASVLFNRSKKLERDFRWAPATLLGNKAHYSFRGIAARCDAEGLHVQFPSYIVKEWKALPKDAPYITDLGRYIGNTEAEIPRLKITARGAEGEYATAKSSLDESPEFDELLCNTAKPAFILNPDDTTESALVSVIREVGEVIHASFLRKVHIRKPRMESGVHNDWRDKLIDVREVSSDQKWCIR